MKTAFTFILGALIVIGVVVGIREWKSRALIPTSTPAAEDVSGDVSQDPDPSLPNQSDDSATEVTAEGTVTSVNLEAMMVDGPALITIDEEGGGEAVIAVPSMGLGLCAAKANIADVSTLRQGMSVEVRGTWTSEGEIVPCESPTHYLRVQN